MTLPDIEQAVTNAYLKGIEKVTVKVEDLHLLIKTLKKREALISSQKKYLDEYEKDFKSLLSKFEAIKLAQDIVLLKKPQKLSIQSLDLFV